MPAIDFSASVVYQIYPRSFCDSNGDGIGDLPGITNKLDYLHDLGVEVIWLSPIYRSPNDDNGYDISDYRAVMDEFGSMADFDALLAGVHQRGMKLMMDLVVNHTSDEHNWFQQACQSRDNPYRDYYLWRAPRAGEHPEPNNWEAAFNGSVWEWHEATGEYYLHMFSRKQPDLNWDNPAVRQEVYSLMRFWLDKGVDGFRMDVINMISKPDGLVDAPVVAPGFLQPSFGMVCNGPRLLDYLNEMRREVLDHYPTITVGEAPLATVEQGVAITHPETGSLNMLFQFEHMDLDSVGGHVCGKWAAKPLDLIDLKTTFTRWQTALAGRGWNSLYFCNHDQPRVVSRFGDDGVWRERSAKMLATCLHGMQGTPYVYQGEELGMTNVSFDRITDYRDIETLNYYDKATQDLGQTPEQTLAQIAVKSRDNARTPMAWSDQPHGGFTEGTPWMGLNPNFETLNAHAQGQDPESVLAHYKALIGLRKTLAVLRDGAYALRLAEHPAVFAYTRTNADSQLLVWCHFGGEAATAEWPADLPREGWRCVLSNVREAATAQPQTVLQPWQGSMYWRAL